MKILLAENAFISVIRRIMHIDINIICKFLLWRIFSLDISISLVINILNVISIEDIESNIEIEDEMLNWEHSEVITHGLNNARIAHSCHHKIGILVRVGMIDKVNNKIFIFNIYWSKKMIIYQSREHGLI